MIAFADASFLVAAFAPDDEHNRAAWRWWKRRDSGIYVSRLVLFEAENNLRGLPLNGRLNVSRARAAIEGMNRARLEGMIVLRDSPSNRLIPQARRLSLHHTIKATYGAMDILHVATALDLGANQFLSFDARQRELAENEGLHVAP